MTRAFTVGIDLGTTNSTAVVFDGEALEPVRTAGGSSLLPSVVRITKQGQVVVGEKARRFLDRDPENTRGGFKRLLGTTTTLSFPAAGVTKQPFELSTEVLRTLLDDLAAAGRPRPDRAVVTVPALFELPQTEATERAARAAGLSVVEMLQEPVASALAGGFRTDGQGVWLVYDLGGGTFDASLVLGEDGLLSVIGHDGDNYLGGRDFDAALAALAAERLHEGGGPRIDPGNPAHQSAWRALLHLAEDAKIALSRSEHATLTADEPLRVDDDEVELDVTIERAAFEERVRGLIDRSIAVAQRLLDAHGRERLDRVVLVGGPTAMPLVRARVAEALGPIAAESLDPMTLVAQGAALFAAQRGLWNTTPADVAAPVSSSSSSSPSSSPVTALAPSDARSVTLKAPPVSTDLLPFVVGSIADPARSPRVARLRLVREGKSAPGAPAPAEWTSAWCDVEPDGSFALGAELVPRKGNLFRVEACDAEGRPIALTPSTLSILQGVTIGDPPVSRSIGVALANGDVHVYLEKGLPLPAKRTFVHHTVDVVTPGQSEAVIKVPLVQGEYGEARFCRLIGTLEIAAAAIDRVLPSGSSIEVTLEVDRGGRMTARAFVPALQRTFEQVATLVVPEASPETLAFECGKLLERLSMVHVSAEGDDLVLVQKLSRELLELEQLTERAQGGDVEAGQRARRAAIDLDAAVSELEARKNWPELVNDALEDAAWASSWVEEHGTPAEKGLLQVALGGLEKARKNRSVRDLERQRRAIRRIGTTAFFRSDDAYVQIFEDYASRVDEAKDLKAATKLVERGRKLVDSGDTKALRPIIEKLHDLMPANAQVRQRSHSSGVR